MEFDRDMLSELSYRSIDENRAEEIIEKKYIRKIVTENGIEKKVPFFLRDSIEDFKQFGEGIYFYFFYLKYFSIVFSILGLLMIYPLILMMSKKTNTIEGEINIFMKIMVVNLFKQYKKGSNLNIK